MKFALTFAAAIIAILCFFGFLNWLTAKRYRPSSEDIKDILHRVLNGTMTWEKWDEFTCVPIRHDKELELIRLKCAEMKDEEYYRRDNAEEQKKWIYNERGLEQIRELLSQLERQKSD